MKYWMLTAAILCPLAANSAVISYEFTNSELYDSTTFERYHATSTLTLDTATSTITHFAIQSDQVNAEFTGSNPFRIDLVEESWTGAREMSLWELTFTLDLSVTALMGNPSNSTGLLISHHFDFFSMRGADPHMSLNWDDLENMEITTDSGLIYFMPGRQANIVVTAEEPSEVPEPASIALLGLGLAGLAWRRRQS